MTAHGGSVKPAAFRNPEEAAALIEHHVSLASDCAEKADEATTLLLALVEATETANFTQANQDWRFADRKLEDARAYLARVDGSGDE